MSDSPTLDATQLRDLEAVLSEMIPAGDAGLPAAGELGLTPTVVGALALDPAAASVLNAGLPALAEAAAGEGAASFADLSAERRLAVLQKIYEAIPEFIGNLLMPTYSAYYSQAPVIRALGVEAWPPHPEGYALEQGDLSLLDPVRSRGPSYREV